MSLATLSTMARPSIGVVTAVQPVHLSRIGTLEAVERAKGELLEALPADGTAVLNADDPIVTRMDRRTAARAVRYGFDDTADVRATDVTGIPSARPRCVAMFPITIRAIRSPVFSFSPG